MDSNLATTNFLLGIMAVAGVIESLFIVALGFAGWKAYREMASIAARIEKLEAQLVSPTLTRLNHVLDDLTDLTEMVRGETERVDHAIHRTIDRVDDTARRMRRNVVARSSRLVGFLRGVRVAIESLLEDDRDVRMNAGT